MPPVDDDEDVRHAADDECAVSSIPDRRMGGRERNSKLIIIILDSPPVQARPSPSDGVRTSLRARYMLLLVGKKARYWSLAQDRGIKLCFITLGQQHFPLSIHARLHTRGSFGLMVQKMQRLEECWLPATERETSSSFMLSGTITI